jgi:Uracil phosphoribosyltransferase
MEVFVLNKQNSIANQFLIELRDQNIQKDRMRFRKNIERLGEIMAYELSKRLAFHKVEIQTPLKKTTENVIANQPVIITVLRAGLPYFQGFLNYFDQSDGGFIGAYRKEGEDQITINLEYLATGDLTGKEVIIVDPMLATGNSFVRSVNALLSHGTPAHVHLVALVAAPEGIDNLQKSISLPATVYTVTLDEHLDERFYIVPGLGDAGDLSFGDKL